MELLLNISAIILSLLGLIGCFVPVVPGPPLSYLAIVLIYFKGDSGELISDNFMLLWLVIAIAVTIIDFLIPVYLTKITGGTNAGAKGSLAGMFAGVFLIPPIGMILGAFLGALLTEMFISGKSLEQAIKPAFGSFLGFILGTGLKLIVSILLFIHLFKFIF